MGFGGIATDSGGEGLDKKLAGDRVRGSRVWNGLRPMKTGRGTPRDMSAQRFEKRVV